MVGKTEEVWGHFIDIPSFISFRLALLLFILQQYSQHCNSLFHLRPHQNQYKFSRKIHKLCSLTIKGGLIIKGS